MPFVTVSADEFAGVVFITMASLIVARETPFDVGEPAGSLTTKNKALFDTEFVFGNAETFVLRDIQINLVELCFQNLMLI